MTILKDVRMGRGNINSNQYESLFKKYNLPSWFTDACFKIKYLFPRAHAIGYKLIAWKLLWFKIHNRKEFNDVLEKYKKV